MRFESGHGRRNSSSWFARKTERSRAIRRQALATFASMESLEIRSLLTAIPPVITNLHLVEDTLLSGDQRTSNPFVEGTLVDPDWAGTSYRVEVDVNSDGIYDTSFPVTPGTPFQFDPSSFVTYGALSLTFRGIEYSVSMEADVRGSADSFSFDFLHPSSVVGNDAPRLALTNLPNAAIPENQSFANRFKVADILVTDDSVGTNALSLAGPDARLFEIDGTQLFIKAGTILDFESLPILQVHVLADDSSLGDGPEATAILMFGVGNVNEAPTVKLPNPTVTVPEVQASSRVKISDIIVLDDALGSHTLTLSGSQASSFEIIGTELFLKAGATLDYEFASLVNIRIEADDPSIGTSFDSSVMLTLIVSDVNEAPVVTTSNVHSQAFPENRRFDSRFEVARFSVADDALGTYVVSLTGADASAFEIDGNSVYLKSGTQLDYETNSSLDVSIVASDIVNSSLHTSAALSFAVSNVSVQSFADVLTVGNDYRGTPIVLDVLANDFSDVGTIAIVSVSSPAHGTATIVNSTTGTNDRIRYVAPVGFTGTVTFTYQVSAGSQNSQATVTLEVVESENVNRNPIVTVLSVTTVAGQSVSVRPLRGVDDLDGDDLEIVGTPTASHGTVQVQTDANGETVFVYAPNAGYQGSDTISFVVGDEYGLTTSASVAVTVTHLAVKAVADRYQVVTGTTLNANSTAKSGTSRSVLVNDLIPSGVTATAALVTGPSHGTLTLQSNGTFSYTPNSGYTGTDSFSYKVHDGVGYGDPQTVEIVVNASGSQTGPNGNIAPSATGNANGAYDSSFDVTVFNGNFGIDPTSRFLATGITTGSNSFTATQTYNESTTDQNNVTTNSVTVIGREKTVYSSVNGSGEWSYLETYSITFDVTMTVPGVSTTHVYGLVSYTFQAWGDSTFSSYNFSTVNNIIGSGTYLTTLGASDITILWNDSEYSTRTITNTTYFASNLSLGTQGGFSQRTFSYLGTGPYEYEIEGGTVTGTITVRGMESSLASTYVNYALDDAGWVAQGVGTANAMTVDFSSAAGSGNFQVTKTGENGLVTSITGTLTEKDDEVSLSNTSAIYLMASTGWALASGASTGNYTSDFRESTETTGSYSYPVTGGSVSGTISGRSNDSSRTTASTLAFVVAGAWQTSGEAHVLESGDEQSSYSGNGDYTIVTGTSQSPNHSNVTGQIVENGDDSSTYSQTINLVLEDAEWEFVSSAGTSSGQGSQSAIHRRQETFKTTTTDTVINGQSSGELVSSGGYEFSSTFGAVKTSGTVVESGSGTSSDWSEQASQFDSDSTYTKGYVEGSTTYSGSGRITASSQDTMLSGSESSFELVDGEWTRTEGLGQSTGDGSWTYRDKFDGTYLRSLEGGGILGSHGSESKNSGNYDFEIASVFTSGDWVDTGTRNETGVFSDRTYFDGDGSTTVTTTGENGATKTVTNTLHEDGYSRSSGSYTTVHTFDDVLDWILTSGQDNRSGDGETYSDYSYTGTYKRSANGTFSGSSSGSGWKNSYYEFSGGGNVVNGAWVAFGTRYSDFSGSDNSTSSGSGTVITTGPNGQTQSTLTIDESTNDKSSYGGIEFASLSGGNWTPTVGFSENKGRGSSSYKGEESRDYSNSLPYGSLSGTETTVEISKEKWSSEATGSVIDSVWEYTGSGKSDSRESRTRTVSASGSYSFTEGGDSYSGNMEEETSDSVTSDVKVETTLDPEGEWITSTGTSKAASEGKSDLTFWTNVTYTNESVTVDGQTYTGTKSVGSLLGSEYSSKVESQFENGAWTTPTGTAKVADREGFVLKIQGTSAYSTTVNGATVSGNSNFLYKSKYVDKIANNYALNTQGQWVFTNKTFEGELNGKFDLKFKVENQQYVKTNLSGLVQGSGSITGTLSHELAYTASFDANYKFDKAGSERVITGGEMSVTRTTSVIDSYSGTGTYTRAMFNASAFAGTIEESGSWNDYWTTTVDYSMATTSSGGKVWAITNGTAMASGSASAKFEAAGDGLDTESDIGVSTSYAGVAIYYVGFDVGTNGGWVNANSAGHTTTIDKNYVTSVVESESYTQETRKNWFQEGTLEFDDMTSSWSWKFEGTGSTQNSGTWHKSVTTAIEGDTTTTWSDGDVGFEARSTIDSIGHSRSDAAWFEQSEFEFVDGVWTEIDGQNRFAIVEYAEHDSVATSELSTTGGAYSITMDSRLESTGDYFGYYYRDLQGPSSAPTGTITWGHISSFASELESSATYHISSNLTIQDNTYQAYSVETLTTSSDFTQAFAGTPQGTVSGIETYQRTYEASDRVYSIMFGAYFQNSTYGDTTSWTWNDPNLSTFDPAQLETIPIRPLSAPQGTPHPFAVPATTKAVWMPPAIIEDPDAPAVEEGEGLSVSGIIRSLIPGISLYDAYQSWKAGDYRGMFLNGGVGTLDLLSLGTFSRSRGLWAFAGGVVKSRVREEVIEVAAGEAGNVVGDRLGAEAGLLTEMLVSGVLSGKLNSQDQKVLGFAANGGAKNRNGDKIRIKGEKYEDFIRKNRGGEGPFKDKRTGRTFDGKLPDGTYYEAKSSFGHIFKSDGIDKMKWRLFQNQITMGFSIAKASSGKYLLFLGTRLSHIITPL